MHSLSPALTLTLTLTQTLNHLAIANKPQQTTSALFGLMYPRTAQRTINIYSFREITSVLQMKEVTALPKLMCFDAAELAESEPAALHFPSSSSSGSPNWLASRPFTLPPVSCLLGSSLDLSGVGSSGSDSMVEIESPEKMLMAEPFFLSAAMRLDPLLLPEVELCGFSGSLTCLR